MMKINHVYLDDVDRCIDIISGISSLQGKSILITGVTGLIGSTVTDCLLEANRKFGLNLTLYLASRSVEKINNRFATWNGEYIAVRYDALEEVTLMPKNCNYVIHCAGLANPIEYSTHPVETLLVGIEGTNRILEFSKKNHVERTVFVSSSEVYGEKQSPDYYTEGDYGYVDILNPRSCYPTAKRACETLCAAYYSEHNVPFVTVRPGHIYGPQITESDSRAHAQFIRNMINGEDIVMKSAGIQLRSYCHSLDCATAIIFVMLNGVVSCAYNISNIDSVVTIRQFAEVCASISGATVIYANPSDVEARGYNLMSNSTLNADKLYALGWRGIFNIEEGLRETYNILK